MIPQTSRQHNGYFALRVGGDGRDRGGGEGGVILSNCGMGVRACISKPTPFIILAFEKTDSIIYLIIRNVDLYIYCSHLLLIVRQILQLIQWIPREQAASKNILSEKYMNILGCQKSGAFHIGIQKKNRVIQILFVEKRGPIIFLAALRKRAGEGMEALSTHIRTILYIGGYPTHSPTTNPPQPPPPPPHTHTWRFHLRQQTSGKSARFCLLSLAATSTWEHMTAVRKRTFWHVRCMET